VIAESQETGRGRMGHSWYSPKGGLWLSALLRPDLPVEYLSLVTSFAALAMCEFLRDEHALPAQIKWPNDVFVDGRKIGGILAESRDMSDKGLTIVMGLGMNVNIEAECFPDELKSIATSMQILKSKSLDMKNIYIGLIRLLDTWYEKIVDADRNMEEIRSRWIEWSETMGKNICLEYKGEKETGQVVDLDPIDGITLRLESGIERKFPSAHTTVLSQNL